MNRRSFLKGLFAVPAVVAVAKVADKATDPLFEQLPSFIPKKEPISQFGMAPIKTQGGYVIMDAAHPKALWPGVKEFWEKGMNA